MAALITILLKPSLIGGLFSAETNNEVTLLDQASPIILDESKLSIAEPSRTNTPLNIIDNDKLNFARLAFKRQHYDVAFRPFNELARVSPEAKFYLAKMYEQGLGVVQNTKRAIRNYSSAAELGSVDGMKALGVLFSSGMILRKNYKEAFHWFHQAAMKGDSEAQGRIALMYKNGQGTPVDLASAKAWIDISCAEKTADICSLRASFLLTPEQLKQSNLLTIKYQQMLRKSASNSSYTRTN